MCGPSGSPCQSKLGCQKAGGLLDPLFASVLCWQHRLSALGQWPTWYGPCHLQGVANADSDCHLKWMAASASLADGCAMLATLEHSVAISAHFAL
jgi:hypothetical protein